jgi:WD40 repeat protein
VGELEEVEQLQAGIREHVLRTARSGRGELRDVQAQAVLPWLCAAAFGSADGEAGVSGAGVLGADVLGAGVLGARVPGARVPGAGVLASVRADILTEVLADAAERARSATGESPWQETRPRMQREISQGVAETLAGGDERANGLRSDIAMVMREVDAAGTMFRAAVEAGDEQMEREVLAAIETVSTEFGEMAFMLADLARAAEQTQDRLDGQEAELRAASEQVGRQSADVRMIREELAVIERRTRQWKAAPQEQPGPGWADRCPYRGLLPYDQAHAAVFYGRERLTAELTGKLAESGIVMVTGASGAGKTSLLQAGLVPALARGVQLPGSASWPRITIIPAMRPLTELAARLAGLGHQLGGRDPAAIRQVLADAPGDAHLLAGEIMRAAAGHGEQHPEREGIDPPVAPLILIIDQFERIFAADDADARLERTAFIEAVCAMATKPGRSRDESLAQGESLARDMPPVRVVIAVSGDHWDRCADFPQLLRAMEHGQLVVGPMPAEDLRRAIAEPAAASGLHMESALIDVIVTDVQAAGRARGSGVLPQLSQAMMATWARRDNGRLTAGGYDAAGRIARAVEVSAESVYDRLPAHQKPIARDVLRQLTVVTHDRRPVGRPLTRTDLQARHPKNQWSGVDAVLGAFARSHLLILGTDVAEIAHDTLLRAWPRLREWLEEDQTSLILHGQLAEDAARWRRSGKDSDRLYRGVQLAAARQAAGVWAADPGQYPALTPDETAFLRASGRASTRGKWRRRTLTGALVLLLVAALTGAGLTARAARHTNDQLRTTDLAGRLAAQSTALDAVNPLTAALLAGAAWRVAPTAEARYSLLESLAQPLRGILATASGRVTTLAYSPVGKTVAAGYADGSVRLWDLASHHLISATSWGSAVLALAFTDGGKTLEVAGAGAVGSWDLTTQAKVTAHPLAADGGASTGGSAVAFSPDGKVLATGNADGNLQLWNTATEQEIGEPMSSDLNPVAAVAFSPDGTTVAAASSDGTVQLWNVTSQHEAGPAIVASSAAVVALTFSPDGKILATGGADGDVRLWDVGTQSQSGATMATGNSVAALSFSPSGATLAAAQGNGSTTLWTVATQRQTGAPLASGASDGGSTVAFSPDGSGLATGNGSGAIQLWNPGGFHQVSAPLGIGTPETPAAGHAPAVLSANGTILAVSGAHGTIRLWNTITQRPDGVPIGGRAVTGLAVSPDGKTLAVAADGLQLWATETGKPIGKPWPAADAAGPVAFSPDGSLVATIGDDGQARLWDVASQQQTGPAMTAGAAAGQGALAFSPGGTTLATVGAGGDARLWNVATQREIGAFMTGTPAQASGEQGTVAAAFSPDGATLATASGNGTLRLWDVATQQEIGAPITAGSQPVYAVAFNSGGTILATASGDGTARLWDVGTQQEIGAPITAGSQPVYAVAFNSGGTMLATASADGTARRWDVSFPASLLDAACAIAGQSFTRQQWADYAGSRPYQQVCPAALDPAGRAGGDQAGSNEDRGRDA